MMFKNGQLVFYVNGKKVWYCFPCFHIWQLLTSLTPSLHCIESWNKQLSLNRTKQTVNWTWAKLSWNCNSGLFNMSQWYICLNFLRMHFFVFYSIFAKIINYNILKKLFVKKTFIYLHSMIIFLYTIKKSVILAYFLSPRQRSCEGI